MDPDKNFLTISNEYNGTRVVTDYLMKYNIKLVMEIIKDFSKWLDNDFLSSIKIVSNHQNYWDIGARFQFISTSFELGFETMEILDNEHHKKYLYKCYYNKRDNKMLFKGEFNLYSDSITDNTQIVYEINHLNGIQLPEFYADVIKTENKKYLKKIEINLKKHNQYKSNQKESIILNINAKSLWEIILDSGKFKKLFSRKKISISIEDEKIINNTNIKIKFSETESNFSVKKCLFEEENNQYNLELDNFSEEKEITNNEYIIPKQKINVIITQINGIEKCLLQYNHHIKRKIRDTDLMKLSKTKTNLLKGFKKEIK